MLQRRMPSGRAGLVAGLLFLAWGGWAVAQDEAPPTTQPTTQPTHKRPLHFEVDGKWIGNGVSYGPHRDGQHPEKEQPTREQLREDLHIMARHWNLIRMYGAAGVTQTVLEIIREDKLPVKVMVGCWIAPEERVNSETKASELIPGAHTANVAEIRAAVKLANAYRDVVWAVSIGNETQVSWSSHRVPPELLIKYIRLVRTRVPQPVTVADDFLFWLEPRSQEIAQEIDFIVTHAYAMWHGRRLDEALPFTKEKYAAVVAAHPGYVVVLGEAGWPTQRKTTGEGEGKLMAGKAGEPEQKAFYEQFSAWTTAEHVPNFYFEAFDENWKGGSDPEEVEKHWGLYNSDRTPKLALQAAAATSQPAAAQP